MASVNKRLAGISFVLAVILSACGGSDDIEGRRVIASPQPNETQDATTVSPAPTTGQAMAGPTEEAAAQTDLPPAPPGSLARARVRFTRIASLDEPVAMAIRRGDGGLYIAEKGGRIRVIRNGRVSGTVVLDVSSQVTSGGEQGFLGIAFSPDGARLYVNFTNQLGNTVIREYAFANGRATASSGRNVLQIEQPAPNHNGGNLVFGPDGYLYIGTGDGGGRGDPNQNAQNVNVLLGKMLRIDPRASATAAYRNPSDNPFVGRDGRDEVWSYGWRNPWRYSFDRATGDMWVGDVGQNAWEEIDYEDTANNGGDNYGWDRLEGNHSFEGSAPRAHHRPIYEYENGGGNCAVTGGYVYRGSRIPDLRGAYVFADFCTGRLRAFVEKDARATEHRFLGPRTGSLASFGEDQTGELYALSLEGGIFRIDRA